MIWYALALALIVAAVVGLATRNPGRALGAGGLALIVGMVVIVLITYSGIWGG